MITLSKTGNSELDEQHSVMEECLSDLASLLDGASCDPVALLGSLEALHSYTEWHFTFEERLQERTKYPNRTEHIAEHRAIIGQLKSLRRKLGAGNRDAMSLISIIRHWIVDHVNSEDSKLANYLTKSQINAIQHDHRLPRESPML